MAKRAKKEKDGDSTGHGVSAIRGNTFDKEMAAAFVDRLLNLNDDLLGEQSKYMTAAKVIRGDMNEVYKEAKDAGIKKKALSGYVQKKILEKRIENIREKLEGEDQDDYDNLMQALGDFGDTALGQAAIASAKTGNGAEAHA